MRYSEIPGALVIGGAWYQFSKQYQNSLSWAGFLGPAEIDFPTFERFAPRDWRARMQRSHPNPDPDYPETLLRQLAALFWTPLNYKREDFQKILAPTLVLVGEKDEMVPPEESRAMAELIPDAELVVIPGAAHSGVLMPGADFIELVLNFFKRNLDDS
jgi:pimeloyl-ACP methyl ester carboxylesterase